jgi:hypothetical protein
MGAQALPAAASECDPTPEVLLTSLKDDSPAPRAAACRMAILPESSERNGNNRDHRVDAVRPPELLLERGDSSLGDDLVL